MNINSGTMNLPGVRAVGALFAPGFADLGFDTTWVDGAAWNRAGHLVARRSARGPGVTDMKGGDLILLIALARRDLLAAADRAAASPPPAALDALGLKGDGGHTVGEIADLRTLPVQAKRVAVMLGRMARGKPGALPAPAHRD